MAQVVAHFVQKQFSGRLVLIIVLVVVAGRRMSCATFVLVPPPGFIVFGQSVSGGRAGLHLAVFFFHLDAALLSPTALGHLGSKARSCRHLTTPQPRWCRCTCLSVVRGSCFSGLRSNSNSCRWHCCSGLEPWLYTFNSSDIRLLLGTVSILWSPAPVGDVAHFSPLLESCLRLAVVLEQLPLALLLWP